MEAIMSPNRKPLTRVDLPDTCVYMQGPVKTVDLVDLSECVAWDAGGQHILELSGDRWAWGLWNERERMYIPLQHDNRLHLVKLTRGLVISLCDLSGYNYPDKILRGRAPTPLQAPPGPPEETPAETRDLVTLNQAAAIVKRQKRTLEVYKTKGELPPPAVEGRPGQFDLWDWKVLRPWLEKTFNMKLPKVFYANRRNA
jgi:hypothetical protein